MEWLRKRRFILARLLLLVLFCTGVFSSEAKAEIFEGTYMEEIGEQYMADNDMNNRFYWLISQHLFHSPYDESEAEKQIKSYVQVPWIFYPDIRWTGPWNGITVGGYPFSNFGCGVVCLTNLYCTITGNKTTPWKMYEWAQEYSSYRPRYGAGAIEWSQMKDVCTHLGLNVELANKPADYGVFQQQMKNTRAMLVLVSAANDGTLWWYTNGHYVVIWEYQPETESVFVSDPSGLYNRERVPLPYIYNALKTQSSYQYLMVRE